MVSEGEGTKSTKATSRNGRMNVRVREKDEDSQNKKPTELQTETKIINHNHTSRMKNNIVIRKLINRIEDSQIKT